MFDMMFDMKVYDLYIYIIQLWTGYEYNAV